MVDAGDRTLALDNSCVREIVFRCALSRPPTAPPFLAGLLDVGGQPVPVVALARLLGLAEAPPGLYDQIVLVEAPSGMFGLAVTRALNLVQGGEARLSPIAAGSSFADCISNELAWPDGRAGVIALDCLLIDAEVQALAHFRAIEKARLGALAGAGGDRA